MYDIDFHSLTHSLLIFFFFFFNDTATTEIYTLSLHDALPIFLQFGDERRRMAPFDLRHDIDIGDRKSTRLNSSHMSISYAVFCLKKKKNKNNNNIPTHKQKNNNRHIAQCTQYSG